MRHLALLALASLLLVSFAPAAEGQNEQEQPKPKLKEKPRATSVWEPLVAANARFVLVGSEAERTRIVVEAYDVRTIQGARVARLRWVVEDGSARSPMGNSLPTQIAVTRKGAWLLTDRMDDKGVTQALKGKPSFTDPPRPVEKDDGYVRKDGDGVCIGVGSLPSKPCPAGVCHAEYCLAPGVGLTSLSGNYTPSAGTFTAPRPTGVAAELRTGVPECDRFLNEWARCVHESMPPEMRDQMYDAMRQMADSYRQAASTPQGKTDIAEACRAAAPAMNDALRGMGCKL